MLKNIVEALIFASGTGLNIDSLINDLKENYKACEIRSALSELESIYSGDRGIHLIKFKNSYQFQTNPKYGEMLADLLMETRERELSKTLLQVLAIIAYKQPVTRQDIENLRGVSSDYVLAMLLKLNLIEPQGRKDAVGYPILYGTTDEFLKKFGIEKLEDMPDYEELMHRIRTNYDKYYAKTQGLYGDFEKDSAGVSLDALDAEVAAASIDDDSEVFDDELPDFLKDEDIIEID